MSRSNHLPEAGVVFSEKRTSLIFRENAGKSLLGFLTGRFTYFSGEKWTTKIIEGKVEVCGNPSTPDYILREKDEVSFISDTISEPEVDSTFEIVYEDEFLFAVNKSGNLPVHPAGRYRNGNLLKILESNSIDPIYISNRIDRETSGLVLFSRSKDIARRINQLFAQRQIQKTYIVYTSGGFPDTLSAIGRMEKDAASLIRKKLKFIPDTGAETGKSDYCETVFRKIGTLSGISKVFAFPKTGRIHQIRSALYSLGFPVLGDKIYGKDETLFLKFIEEGESEELIEKSGFGRQALHSFQLMFNHPVTGKFIHIEAPEPDDMKKIFGNQRYES